MKEAKGKSTRRACAAPTLQCGRRRVSTSCLFVRLRPFQFSLCNKFVLHDSRGIDVDIIMSVLSVLIACIGFDVSSHQQMPPSQNI